MQKQGKQDEEEIEHVQVQLEEGFPLNHRMAATTTRRLVRTQRVRLQFNLSAISVPR